MKNLIIMFGSKVVCLASIAGAVFLAANDKEGWGWLIFVAMLTAVRKQNDKTRST
jgi:hypothetical protein